MKKIFVLAFVCLISFSFILTGCNLFPRNQANYLNAPIITFKTDDEKNITVTKKELLSAFNSYGSTLMNNYGYDVEKSVEEVIKVLINREVTLVKAKKEITLGNGDLNDIWDSTYETMLENLATYEEEVIKAWGLQNPAVLGDEEDSSKEYKPYEKLAEIEFVDNEYVIKIKDGNSETDQNVELYYGEGEEVSSILNSINEKIENSGNKDVLTEAKRLYIEDLKEGEKGFNLSTDKEEIFEREIERVRETIEENKYVELYEKSTRGDGEIANITINQVLTKLTAQMLSSYTEYKFNPETYSSDMLSSFSDVKYVIDENYFFVNHILLKYNEDSATQIENLKTAFKNGTITEKAYNDGLEIEAAKIRATNIQTEKQTSYSPTDLFNIIESELTGKSANQKTEIFKDYVYTYNEDTGNMNSDYLYIIGKNDSKMVETFTDVSRELYDNGNGEYGEIGYALSDYGVHIIFYAGVVENPFTITNPDTFNLVTTNEARLAEIVETISTTKLNPFHNKTIFDLVYEELVTDNYSIFANMNYEKLKKEISDLTIHKSNYKDLLN